MIRIGGMTLDVRPWPTPDPEKCCTTDRIGVLVPVDWQSPAGIKWFVPDPIAPSEAQVTGLTSEWRDPASGHALKEPELGESPGWFWASEPQPLLWEERPSTGEPEPSYWFGADPNVNTPEDAEAIAGIRTEVAMRGHLIREPVPVFGVVYYLGEGTLPLSATRDTLDEAKAEAARMHRDVVTRRYPEPPPR